MRVRLDDCDPKLKARIQQAIAKEAGGGSTNTTTNVEQAFGNEPMGKKACPRLNPPCRCHIHSIRKRLADSDGVSGKACIDGIVLAGILPDDSPQYIKEVSYSQEQAGEESTIITIEEIL